MIEVLIIRQHDAYHWLLMPHRLFLIVTILFMYGKHTCFRMQFIQCLH